ncbi:MAG: nucleotide sugar dehydrogenase [Deltaproteobacteria bacterium]|jgi:UDPglucose 6-dehydrogenase|nr:nucleotide sugar dehydrogenase [Deltaproteobacteria bacterium]
MRLAVLGLWHLGQVVAAGSASAGHQAIGWDASGETVRNLRKGLPSVAEPGLAGQILAGLANGTLSFEEDLAKALQGAEVAWVAFDTPVDEDDVADAGSVISGVGQALPLMDPGTVVLVSSQLPAGSVGQLERLAAQAGRGDLEFACSPENLRLGQALSVFSDPDRVVCGVRTGRAKEVLQRLFSPITDRIEWMGVESAEMTKHAINAFLALSATFANELASICEALGADAKEVERGLRTEGRIGPKAYLGPGLAFAGGTLARDLGYLSILGRKLGRPASLAEAALASNDRHKNWVVDSLARKLGDDLSGRAVALWGLAYKPGTDTLRRSAALEIAARLHALGATVRAHDPAIRSIPDGNRGQLALCGSALEAASGAQALVVCTAWPEYLEIEPGDVISSLARPLILDPAGFLRQRMAGLGDVEYVSIGFDPGRPEMAARLE